MIKFEEQGHIDPKIMKGLRLQVYSEDLSNQYIGVVLTRISKDPKAPTADIEDLLLDVGASSKEELIKMGINLGSMITFEGDVQFQGSKVIGKSADNRAGVSIVHELADYIKVNKYDFNIILGASVQEEVGLRGARTSANKYKPDLAMVVDVSPARDGFGKEMSGGNLGEGTILRHKDAYTVFPKSVTNFVRSVASKNKIKLQDYFSQGGTNSGIIHISNSGTVVIPLGFPARNLHMPSQVFDINDYDQTVELAKAILKTLSASKIKNFKQLKENK
jgi:glutamyl aminopeptidase